MKKTVSITAMAVAVAALFGCEQFSTSYQRIDDSEFRMLKYIWEPTDAAPGDTITLTAVFAGKRKDDLRNDLDWLVSFNVIRDLFGNTTVVDSDPFNAKWEWRPVVFSPNTQAIEFKIQVPDSIVRKSASIPEDWADALPAQLKNALPAGFASMTKTQIVDTIEFYADTQNIKNIRPEIAGALIPILQYFTVPMRVFTKMREPGRLPHTIVSTQYIRYNNRFKKIGVPVNNIPIVDKVVVYKVKGDVSSIDDKSGVTIADSTTFIGNDTVITVEKGYSYFLDAISNNIDTSVTMNGNKILEKHRIYRQFQLDKNEIAGIHHSKYMTVNNLNGKITMPADKNITKFIFWLTVYDEVQNERLRPPGETLVERSGRLEYK